MKRRKVDFKQEMLMMLVFSSRDKKKTHLQDIEFDDSIAVFIKGIKGSCRRNTVTS